MGTFRFILAFNVVFFHLLDIANIGPLAVYSFFVLSGYLMTHIMQNTYSYTFVGIAKYGVNRFWRLFPAYWLLALLSVVAFILGPDPALVNGKMTIPQSIPQWLANVSLIYPDLRPASYPARIAPATWALTIEIGFYILIGIGLSRTKLITVLWFCASMLYLFYHLLFGGSYVIGYGTFAAASIPFSLGAMSYYYRDWVVTKSNSIGAWYGWLLIALFVFNVVLSALSDYLFGDSHGWKIATIAVYVNLVLSFLLVIHLASTKARFKSIDRVLGDLSYPVYVFHWTGAYISYWMFGSYSTVSGFLVSVLATLLVSVGVNHLLNSKINAIREKNKVAR